MADAPGSPFSDSERPDASNEDTFASLPTRIAELYRLHGPPGPCPADELPACPAAPFVEPRTAPFPVHLSTRDLTRLLRGCAPSGPACPWQDVCESPADEGTGDMPEHRWVVYAAGEDGAVKLQMHRSWTGIKLIELTLDNHSIGDTPLEADEARTDEKSGTIGGSGRGITHITFETHGDYKLKGADEGLYKSVAREVCWWILGVCLGPEAGG